MLQQSRATVTLNELFDELETRIPEVLWEVSMVVRDELRAAGFACSENLIFEGAACDEDDAHIRAGLGATDPVSAREFSVVCELSILAVPNGYAVFTHIRASSEGLSMFEQFIAPHRHWSRGGSPYFLQQTVEDLTRGQHTQPRNFALTAAQYFAY